MVMTIHLNVIVNKTVMTFVDVMNYVIFWVYDVWTVDTQPNIMLKYGVQNIELNVFKQ